MTEAAERVKAFCKRVVDYEKAYQEYWKNQETYNSKNVFYCDKCLLL